MTEDPDHVPMSLGDYWRGRKTPDLEVALAGQQELLRFAERKGKQAVIQTCRFCIDMLERELRKRQDESTLPAGLGS